MDFAFTQEEESARHLARQIFTNFARHASPGGWREAEAEWFHRPLWGELSSAGLLGIAAPEEVGGADLGFVALCLLLTEQGRAVAPVPLLPALVMGALPVARFGSEEQRRSLLPQVLAGELVLTAALMEPGAPDPCHPETRAEPEGPGWRVSGTKICVPAAHLAGHILVPARAGGGEVLMLLVDPAARGMTLERQTSTTSEPLSRLTLSGARVGPEGVLGGGAGGGAMLEWLVERTLVGLCAIEIGVAERQVELVAEYTTRRQQFGRPIASFQAVAQRAADACIDLEAIRLSTWQAAWRLAEGLPASKEVAVAKFWASEAGARVACAAQHLHGGMGFDRGYPLYRYYLWAKQIELTLGAGTSHLCRLGAELAREPPARP